MIKLLARAVGPSLAAFGVGGTLADPQMTLFSGATSLASNDNWSSASNAAAIATAANNVGAFAIDSGTRDAAMLIEVGAGSYTVAVSGVGNTTGTALVEFYVLP